MLDIFRQRRSVRTYLDRPVEEEKIKELLRAAMFSPTSRATRAWEFIVIRDKEKLHTLSGATPFSGFLKDAPLGIAICYDPAKGRRYKEDSSIAAGYIYLECVNQGLGSCYIQVSDAAGDHGDAEDYVKKLLGIPEGYRAHCIMSVGYPAVPTENPDSLFQESKIHYERF